MFEWQSALAPQLSAGGRDGANGARALRLTEVRGWQLTQVFLQDAGGRNAQLEEARQMLAVSVGGTLPQAPDAAVRGSAVVSAGSADVYRLARDQFWVVDKPGGLATRVLEECRSVAFAVTSLSHGRVRVALGGAPAREVLARVLSVDVDPRAFPVGHALQTGLHHVGVLVHHCADLRYEFYLPRSYARSCWEWLADAALVFGYDVDVEQT